MSNKEFDKGFDFSFSEDEGDDEIVDILVFEQFPIR